jgi:hypothetical protein
MVTTPPWVPMGAVGEPAIRLPPFSTRIDRAQKSMVASAKIRLPPAMTLTFPN